MGFYSPSSAQGEITLIKSLWQGINLQLLNSFLQIMTGGNSLTELFSIPVLKGVIPLSMTWNLSRVVFQPFEEVKKAELEIPITPQVLLARQKYEDKCEATINVEYTVSYVYHSLCAYFDRDNVALKGVANKDYEGNGCKVAISAPRLMTFKYCSSASIMVYLLDDDFASLHDAYVDIHSWFIWVSKAETFDKFSDSVLNWVNNFKKFRHSESLTLSGEMVAVLSIITSLMDRNQLQFSNLKYLMIKLEPGKSCNDKFVEMVGSVLKFFSSSSTTVKYVV